jgi:hypothetical protein
MPTNNTPSRRPDTPGRAVDDEDPGRSPMEGSETPAQAAEPYDVEKVESDRAKSMGAPRKPAQRQTSGPER